MTYNKYKKVKKVLFIHHAVGWGGAPNSMIKLINDLDSSRYNVEVLLLKNSIVADKLTENGIKYKIAESIFYKKYYHYFTHSEAGYVKWYYIYRFIKLSVIWVLSRYYFSKKELKKHFFDIAHLNSSVLTDWLAPAKAKGKVVIHIREPFKKGPLDVLHYFFKHQMSKYADQIIAISQNNADRIALPQKTEVVYNYSDIPQKDPHISSYFSKKLLYLGGASSIKGFYTLIEALDYLDKDVKIYFGGTYTASKKNRNKVKRFLKKILFYGKKRQNAIEKIRSHPNAIEIGMTKNVDSYLDEVCCMVSPFSVPHFSRPVIEAHLHKKPAIGSDADGMEEIIAHGENGLIVPKNNPKALAEAINFITSNGELAKKLGEEGFRIAKEKYSPKNIKKIENIYKRLLY
jgi:glycosyltransferase involved in cell wall biosynthesis